MATDAFPDKKFSDNCYTHNVVGLRKLARLTVAFDTATGVDPALLDNWGIANGWSEQKRYHRVTETEARLLFDAVSDAWGTAMDTCAMVNDQLDSGKQLIQELRQTGFDVSVAFWTKPSDEGMWFLYMSSPTVDEKGARAAYRHVYGIIRRMPELGIDPLEVRLIGAADSMADAAAGAITPRTAPGSFAVQDPRPYAGITRFGGLTLGGVNIDGAYIYPPRPVALA